MSSTTWLHVRRKAWLYITGGAPDVTTVLWLLLFPALQAVGSWLP
jgi:hypothetical protein